MLVPPANALTKDAVLIFGGMGAMKTTAWCHIRKWYEITNTPGHFYVLCTELESVMRCAEEYTDGTPGNNFFSNCTVEEVHDYDSLVGLSKKFHESGTPNDWLVCDSLSDPQEWSRDTYFTPTLGMTWSEFARSGRPMLDIKPQGWGQMRAAYQDWFNTYFLRWPGPRFATARSKRLDTSSPWSGNESGKAKRTEYGHVGYFPVGYDQIGYPFHTVIYAAQTGPTTRQLTTAKDRAREYQADREVKDFVMDWLLPVSHWELTQD